MPKILKVSKESEYNNKSIQFKEQSKQENENKANTKTRTRTKNCVLPALSPRSKESSYNTSFNKLKDENKLDIIWIPLQIESFNPESREGGTMSVVNDSVYLFGGFSRKIFNDLCILKNISFGCNSKIICWENAEILNKNPATIPIPRFAHSASVINSDIIIFGGSKLYNKQTKIRQCLNDIYAFHTETSKWEEIKSGGIALEPRRNHVSCIIGKNFLIHGGMDEHGNYLSDCLVSTLIKKENEYNIAKWGNLVSKGDSPGPIAFHACSLVLALEKYYDQYLGMFYVPDLKSTKILSKVL